ncbi:MAG TPA: hypothetical protein PKZ42_07385 [Syntrophales bacterium]|nr:hypothetical protein [Syntrophales bacterium]
MLYILLYSTVIFLIFFIPFSLVIRALGKRTREMRIAAVKRGFSFNQKGDGSFLAALKDFFLILPVSIDYSQERNLLTKREGSTGITLADLGLKSSKYRTDSFTVPVTVLCFRREDFALPEFCITPGAVKDGAGPESGYGNIDFEGHPDLSRRYTLRGKDETTVRDLFSRSGITNLFEWEEGLCVEGKGPLLIVYKYADGAPCIIPVADLDAFIDMGRRIFTLLSVDGTSSDTGDIYHET